MFSYIIIVVSGLHPPKKQNPNQTKERSQFRLWAWCWFDRSGNIGLRSSPFSRITGIDSSSRALTTWHILRVRDVFQEAFFQTKRFKCRSEYLLVLSECGIQEKSLMANNTSSVLSADRYLLVGDWDHQSGILICWTRSLILFKYCLRSIWYIRFLFERSCLSIFQKVPPTWSRLLLLPFWLCSRHRLQRLSQKHPLFHFVRAQEALPFAWQWSALTSW